MFPSKRISVAVPTGSNRYGRNANMGWTLNHFDRRVHFMVGVFFYTRGQAGKAA